MASTISTSSLLFIIIIFFTMSTPHTAFMNDPCNPVFVDLLPCLPSFSAQRGRTAPTMNTCCTGAQGVAKMAKTPLGKLLVCTCLRKLMTEFPVINPGVAQNVTARCNAPLSFTFSVVDCMLGIGA